MQVFDHEAKVFRTLEPVGVNWVSSHGKWSWMNSALPIVEDYFLDFVVRFSGLACFINTTLSVGFPRLQSRLPWSVQF